jgi:hypothetical protein
LKGKKRCNFVAQGTLINKHSIAQTIDPESLHGPVVTSGVRRIFNFALMDENYEEHGGRYKRSTDSTHCATLNILSTGNVQDKVNGILFSASADDIDSLAEREYGYDLLPVEYRRTDETAYAYMFIARQGSKAVGNRVLDDILPNESSLSICLHGAATYGTGFLRMWIESCYLADETPLMEHSYYQELVLNLSRVISSR